MERLNLRRIKARFGGTGQGSARKASGSSPDGSLRRRRLLSLAIVLAVLACMALTVTANMGRNAAFAPNVSMNMALTQANAQATAGMAESEFAMRSGSDSSPAAEAREVAPATGGANQPANPNWDRMIIRTATLQIQVKDVASTLDTVRNMAGAHAGYVSQSESRIEGEYTVATITMQVPVREFDNVISKLRKVGIKPLGENISSSDVTEEYTDLESQLRNLRATEQRMIALMQKAERIEDILALDREMRQIQGEIERTQGRLNYLGKRSEMSTIMVSLYPEVAAVAPLTKPAEAWDPIQVAQRAWEASLELLSGIASAVITVAVFMWWAIPFLLLAAWLARRPRRQVVAPQSPSAEA